MREFLSNFPDYWLYGSLSVAALTLAGFGVYGMLVYFGKIPA